MIKKKKHGGPSGGGGLREAPFHGGGAPMYPSPTAVSSPYRTRPFAMEMGRHNASTLSPSFEEFDEENIEEAYAYAANVGMKRREMGWSTSFPAEYHNAHQSNDYKQTLAFQEQLNLRKRSEQQIADAVLTANASTGVLPKRGPGNAANSSPNKQYLELIKQVNMREGILSKLKTLANTAAVSGNGFDADAGSELLQLLLQLRDASVSVVSAMAKYHHTTPQHGGGRLQAFVFQNQNYCVKMVSDLNFLAHFSSLSRVLGVDAVRMKQNPFMMPSPIPDRDFHDVQSAAPPRFAFADPAQRVAEAEKYLVWSLVNLSDASTVQHDAANAGGTFQPAHPQSAAPPPLLNGLPAQPPPGSSHAKRELLTWQQRAESQLRMLSMPLELAPGHAHVMDSSRMMKRKGYLPALPLSPPKTLTQLMDNVHKGGYTSPTKSSGFASFEVHHDGIPYRMTAFDVEVLGSNEAPPHTIVTLVSASVLILLSPSDRIPKDLSWTSCQKMLANGLRLIQRVEGVDIDGIPAFKWKALLPFLQNEHFDPMFLMEYSCAAATLCAWVLHVLERAQYNDTTTMKNDTDRRELLQEMEREDEDEQQQQLPPCKPPTTPTSALRPPSRASTPHGGKRVTIGNAEVLFINENEPVSPPSTASRPLSSASLTGVASSSSIVAQPRRHVLLRTSPWTHRGVTYFVSFFLEKSDDDEMLSVKMYEPMSSVESQMFVSPDDLALDFGDRAAEFFQRRDFGLLCELILSQLDGMITGGGGSAPPSRDERRTPGSHAVLQLTGRKGHTQQDENEDHDDDDAEAAAVRIQCLARRQHAKKRVDGLRAQRKDEATTRIQCAIRQRHARNKVQHVRFAKQQHREEQELSAIKIQSIARQRQAQQLVSHMRLLERIPTGLPVCSFDDETEEPETSELPNDGNHEGNSDGMVLSAEALERHEQQAEDVGPHQVGAHTSQIQSDDRPQTSMSYASEQFEEDFEADE